MQYNKGTSYLYKTVPQEDEPETLAVRMQHGIAFSKQLKKQIDNSVCPGKPKRYAQYSKLHEVLWATPSDHLIRMLIQKPPLYRRRRHTVTTIDDYDDKMELTKEEYEIRRRIEFAVQRKELELTEKMKKGIDEAIKNTRLEEQLKHSEDLKETAAQIKEGFTDMLRDQEIKVRTEMSQERSVAQEVMVDLMKEERQLALEAQEEFLTKVYDFQLQWRTNKIFEEYVHKLNDRVESWRKIYAQIVESEAKKREKLLGAAAIENQCLLYKIVEKEKNESLVRELQHHKEYYSKLRELESQMQEFQKKNEDHSKENNALREEIHSWRCIARALIKQMQKFIDFCAGEKPGYGEFLFSEGMESLEKLVAQREKHVATESDLKILATESSIDLFEKVYGVKEVLETLPSESQEVASYTLQVLLERVHSMTQSYEILNSPRVEHTSPPSADILQYIKGTYDRKVTTDKFEKLLEKQRAIDRVITVVGLEDSENDFPNDFNEFTKQRINSIAEIFAQHPSLASIVLPK